MTSDDNLLWDIVKRTTKPLNKKSREVVKSKPIKSIKLSESDMIDRIAAQKLSYGSNLSVQHKLTSSFKAVKIQARIDLHGMTCAQAEEKLRSFLVKAQCLGNKTVLVITGKGRPDKNSSIVSGDYALGTLRNFTMRWLDNNPQWVVSYAQASSKDGGLGAFYVHVRRQK